MKNNPILHQKLAVSCDIEYENIKDLFLTQMQKTPNKIFLIIHGDKKEQFTYLEFKNIIFKTINFMKTKNLKKNDIISLIFHNSSEFLILYFAGLFYGLTIVPINPDMSSREIEYIIRNSNSKIVFYNHTLESKIVLVQKNLKEKNYLQIHTIHELTSSFDDEIEFNSEKDFQSKYNSLRKKYRICPSKTLLRKLYNELLLKKEITQNHSFITYSLKRKSRSSSGVNVITS